MSFSKLRERISIQQRQQLPELDAAGQPQFAWVELCRTWADVRFKSGMETLRGSANVSIVQASIRIRSRGGLDAGMRIVHGAVIYNIKAVPPLVSGNQYMDLIVEAGANEG